jgi:hypothetical protein
METTNRINSGATAPVVYITTNKKRVKQFGRNVYLNDGESFELEMYNPTSRSVLAKIRMNGDYISMGGIVLRPGERVYLERYLDTNAKFVFNTYSVDGSEDSLRAIELNGDVRVDFFKEYVPTTNRPWYGNTTVYPSQFIPVYHTASPTVPMFSCSGTATGAVNTTRTILCDSSTTTQLETGRIMKGAASAQHFTDSNTVFSNFSFHSESWKILPMSLKVTTAGSIPTVYCTNCGVRRRKVSYRFCPRCGTNF